MDGRSSADAGRAAALDEAVVAGSRPAASSSSAAASSGAVRRLRRDLVSFKRSGNKQIEVAPSEANLLEWHFVLHSLPADTPYRNGVYHGKLLFPPEYPYAPPTVFMVTPNGRLATDSRLCLSMTDFHPEEWNPAWSVETMLVGLLSVFTSDTERGVGTLLESPERRRQLAEASQQFNALNEEFMNYFAELVDRSQEVQRSSSPQGPEDAASAFAGPESASPSLEAEVLGAAQGRDLEAQPAECWICRQSCLEEHEPLVQPCRCRGSMSNVHASCVERWIRAHRRSSGAASQIPRCSVCKTPYVGSEQRPGLAGFARHHIRKGTRRFARSACLVLLLWAFHDAMQSPDEEDPQLMPMFVRVLITGFFWMVVAFTFGVLSVSLPFHRAPPRHRWAARWLFKADPEAVAQHATEGFVIVLLLVLWTMHGEISPFVSSPIVAIAGPMVLANGRCRPTCSCLVGFAKGLAQLTFLPLSLARSAIRAVRQNPSLAFVMVNPLEPPVHIVVACLTTLLSLYCESNVLPVALWTLHTVFLVVAFMERIFLRKLIWQGNISWWQLPQFALISSYSANTVRTFSRGFGAPEHTKDVVFGVTLAWLLAVCAFAVSVNWKLCMRRYNHWQRRHGDFRLLPRSPALGFQQREGFEDERHSRLGRLVPVRGATGDVDDFV
eukprot:TRINITY_DN1421_c1_g2_i1.p1 TRINITY_DN1421_c1_g2~~TRINITY_DN1421_c1_g2_i1.p1  ORF type:complete len:686 (+),score=124.21 TRINITY_DN1421_c1_g2_i1:59-2059(+)